MKKYLDGEDIGGARYLLYAVRWDTGATGTDFPKSMAALAGFKNVSSEKMKDPNAWEAVLLAAEAGLRRKTPAASTAAVASLIQFDTLSRPSELLEATGQWIFKSGDSAVMTFYPSSQTRTDKTKQQDDTVIVGEVAPLTWLKDLALALNKRSPSSPLFPLTLA